MKEFNLEFDGYYIDMNSLPTYGGIYCVYSGSYNPNTDKVSVGELVYIGEAENIQKRHTDVHEHQEDFDNSVKGITNGKVLYSTAKLENENDRKRVENALIYHEQPDINTDGKDSFKHPFTRIVSSGRVMLKDNDFTQDRVD